MKISLEEAVRLLQSGQVVGVPTETVYGLAASLHHPEAIKNIYRLKGRPSNNPLIIHVANPHDMKAYVEKEVLGFKSLSEHFWPGPITLVLPVKQELVPAIARAQLPTAAFRIPQHPLARELIRLTGPLVMPSANLSGRPSSTSSEHVENDFGQDFPVLDGNVCQQGVESTILIYRDGQWKIGRQGALPAESFQSLLGYMPSIEEKVSEQPLCPGQMYRHYAPKAKLTLMKSFENISQGVILGFSDRHYPTGCVVLSLGPLSSPEVVASNLYSTLRLLDQKECQEAYVDINFPKEGLFSTIAERLQRASVN